MQKIGIIKPASSPWLSPILMVTKPNNQIQFCCNFKKLNAVTDKKYQPLPWINNNLNSLSGAKWFSVCNLKFGFWQIEINKKSKPKTVSAFALQGGQQWQFCKLAFGLSNSPSIFTCLMQLTFLYARNSFGHIMLYPLVSVRPSVSNLVSGA